MVSLALIGCDDTQDVFEGDWIDPSESASSRDVGENVHRVATLTSAVGSTIEFLEVDHADGRSVFVFEQGDGRMMLDEALSLLGDEPTASEIYLAVAPMGGGEPAEVVPLALAEISGVPSSAAPRSADVMQFVADENPSAAGGFYACNNSSFASSTPGGLLAKKFTRFNIYPGNGASYWYNYPGSNVYYYKKQNSNVSKWRGKTCMNYVSPGHDWGDPWFGITYEDNSGGSANVVSVYIPGSPGDGVDRQYAWYWNGPGVWDWRVQMGSGYLDTWDILTSWP